MNKPYFLLVLLVISTILLSACAATGQQPAEFILPPDSPEAQAYGGNSPISIDNRPTIQQKYEECEAKIDYTAPGMEVFVTSNTYGQQAATIFYCGEQQQGLTWVAVATLTTVIPGGSDDVAVRAILILKSGVKLVGLLTAAYIVGETIEYTIDSASYVSMDTAMDEAFGNYLESTKHRTSKTCLAGAFAYSLNGLLHAQGDGMSSGSIQMWAGINGDSASVAILMIVGKQVNFLVIKGKWVYLGFATAPSTFLNLGGGKYLDTASATWVAAWVMSKTIGKEDNPADFLTVGDGLANWKFYQAKYGLYIPVAAIALPPMPPMQ